MLGTGSLAQASESDGGKNTGGYVLTASMVGVYPVYHPRSGSNHAGAKRSYAFAPSVTRKGAVAASQPWSGCDHVFNYDWAMNGYTYDLVCNGVDLTSRAGVSN